MVFGVLNLSESAKTWPFPKRNFACHIVHDADSDLQSDFDASCASADPGTIKLPKRRHVQAAIATGPSWVPVSWGKWNCLEKIWTIDVNVQSKASKRDQIRNGNSARQRSAQMPGALPVLHTIDSRN